MVARFAAKDVTARYAEIKLRCQGLVGPSTAEAVAALPAARRREIYQRIAPVDWRRVLYAWRFWARPKQIAPPGDWFIWLNLAGRGCGKTRTGAEWVRERVASGARKLALIAPTYREARQIMIGGDDGKDGNGSGILDVCPPWDMPVWKHNQGELHFPSGAVAFVITAEKPESRGYNFDTIWWDEIAFAKHGETLWQNIKLATRKKGRVRPRMCVTSTPRPINLLRELIMHPHCVTTHAHSFENSSNLAQVWLDQMKRDLEGTRLGQQELEADLLGDNPESLFQQSVIDLHRVREAPAVLLRVVVAVDPAVSTLRHSDDTGIVAIGLGADGHVYVLADLTGRYSPERTGEIACDLAVAWGADAFVVERNKIGLYAAANLRAAMKDHKGLKKNLPICEVYSSKDKANRAEPVSAICQKGRLHFVGRLARLEDEITEWNPQLGISPNGLDAMVHGVYELLQLTEAEVEKHDPKAAFRGLAEANRGFADHRWGAGYRQVI